MHGTLLYCCIELLLSPLHIRLTNVDTLPQLAKLLLFLPHSLCRWLMQSAVQVKVIRNLGLNSRNSPAQAAQCARYASACGCTENKGLPTDQAQPTPEASLARQRAFASPCVSSHCCLLAALLRILNAGQDSWLVLPEGLTFAGYCFL